MYLDLYLIVYLVYSLKGQQPTTQSILNASQLITAKHSTMPPQSSITANNNRVNLNPISNSSNTIASYDLINGINNQLYISNANTNIHQHSSTINNNNNPSVNNYNSSSSSSSTSQVLLSSATSLLANKFHQNGNHHQQYFEPIQQSSQGCQAMDVTSAPSSVQNGHMYHSAGIQPAVANNRNFNGNYF